MSHDFCNCHSYRFIVVHTTYITYVLGAHGSAIYVSVQLDSYQGLRLQASPGATVPRTYVTLAPPGTTLLPQIETVPYDYQSVELSIRPQAQGSAPAYHPSNLFES